MRNVCLLYIVKDNHCHPITDEKLKLVASKAKRGGCSDLLKHMFELKWKRRYETVMKIKTKDDIINLEKENHIIVLPEDMKTTEAINTYMLNNNYYSSAKLGSGEDERRCARNQNFSN